MNRSGLALRVAAVLLLLVVIDFPALVSAANGASQSLPTNSVPRPLKDGQDDEAEPTEVPEVETPEPTEPPEDTDGSDSGDSGSGSGDSGSGSDNSDDSSNDDGSDGSGNDDGSNDATDDNGSDGSDGSSSGGDGGNGDSPVVEDDSIDGTSVSIVDVDGDVTTDGFRAGQVVVRLQPGASIKSFNKRHNTKLVAEIGSHDLYLLELPADVSLEQAEQQLSTDADTRWSELNYVNQAPEGRPGYFFVSGEPGTDAEITYAPQLLGYVDAQSCGTGEGVVVAILDSGIDATHPALQGRIADNGWNALNDSTDVRDIGNGLDDDGDGLVDEMVGHGTHVAGIVAQVAPGATILPVKVLGSDGVGDAFYVAAGIHYAVDQGANVINLSLSSTYDARVVAEAVAEANEAGVVVVAAAGNNSTNRVLEFPAADTGVMGIAATDKDDHKSDFSNYGDRIDLSAPGVDIVSSLPGGLYAAWSGTSMASPFVAGAAALVAGAHPSWTAQQISNRLLQKSGDIDKLNPDFAGELGAGRLDIEAAVGCKSSQTADANPADQT